MKFSCALKLNHIFRRLYRTTAYANPLLVLYVRPNGLCINRIGLTVSKKLGKAVVRNRIRRRLREAYRCNEAHFKSGFDIVVVARSRIAGAPFAAIVNAYLALAEKAGIFVP